MASKLINGGRKWVSTELKGNDTGVFREYCRDMHLNFETSDAGYGYTHFEVLVSDDEMEKANQFIDERLNGVTPKAKTRIYYLKDKHDGYIIDIVADSLEEACKLAANFFHGSKPEDYVERF